MKKYISIVFLIFSLCACRQDFLEEKTVNTLNQDFYKTASGLESLVKGSYQILRFKADYNQGQYLFGTSTDVEVFKWTDQSAPDRMTMGSYAIDAWGPNATGTRMTPNVTSLIGIVGGNNSEGVYPEVSRCNLFLENYTLLDSITRQSLKARKGEILFLRAYSYYLITNVLGPVPLVLKSYSGMPANFSFPKESLENIYKQMITDLTDAIKLLPATTSELGRITQPAASHLLSKLYLNRAQAANWENSPEAHLKMLYKGNVSGDLDSAIFYSSKVINQFKGNSAYGGLETNFGSLWKNALNDYTRDKSKEIILSAQYEPTQAFDGRYGNTLVHLYNSNYTTLTAGVSRSIVPNDYGRPYATAGATDWGTDMYTDRANDSRYYKTYLTDYNANDNTITSPMGKKWDVVTTYYYNNRLKPSGTPNAVSGAPKIKYQARAIVYIENSKDQPFDSLWVVSQPFIMMVRWMMGSPGGAGYVDYLKSKLDPSKDSVKSGNKIVANFKTGADIDPINPIVTDVTGRKLMYRISGDVGEQFGLDWGPKTTQWYMGPRKWLDLNRGKGTDPNGNGAIDIPLFRLAETYLIRAEAYGRQGNYGSAITDLNILRKRAAYHAGENRSEVLITLEPSVITGKLVIPASEKIAPYAVTTDSYNQIAIDGTEWQGGSPKAILENYPQTAASDDERFIHFIYNERARELIFEETNWEDLHNAGILYERVYYRDQMGAPSSSTGTSDFPFAKDDITKGAGTVGARGIGKGQFDKHHTFKAWPQSFLNLLTDEKNNPLDDAAKAAYQNPGY